MNRCVRQLVGEAVSAAILTDDGSIEARHLLRVIRRKHGSFAANALRPIAVDICESCRTPLSEILLRLGMFYSESIDLEHIVLVIALFAVGDDWLNLARVLAEGMVKVPLVAPLSAR